MIQSHAFSSSMDRENTDGMPFGATLTGGGVSFKLWAPTSKTVHLNLHKDNEQIESFEMARSSDAVYTHFSEHAKAGTLYSFTIDGGIRVPDPFSRYQPEDVQGPSQVMDPSAFRWSDQAWRGRPWEETVLYELHVGTFTKEGTFASAREKLDHLADLGVTAVELMPLADFPGKWNWGYDGVLQFAPDSTYGTPNDLKAFVQAAHDRNLMVFLDVVYNHFGPEGNYLYVYAREFFTDRHKTPWGDAIDFEGNRYIRQFFISNAMYWLSEFHIDGLRFDAVHAIKDRSQNHILKDIARTVRGCFSVDRHIHLVLENDDNTADYLERSANLYTAQWNDDAHHSYHVVATRENSGYYLDFHESTSDHSAVRHLARALAEGFAYQGEPSPYRQGERRGQPSTHLSPTAFVDYVQNHDQVGNRAFGERITLLAKAPARLALFSTLLLSPSIPLLFMGDEWGCKTPFNFFCDLGDHLAAAVTEGRRNEFARFPEFHNPQKRAEIPDPCLAQTRHRSVLEWGDLKKTVHKAAQSLTKSLIALRHESIVPLLPLPYRGSAFAVWGSVIRVSWRFGEKTLRLVANYSDDVNSIPASEQLFDDRFSVVFSTHPDRINKNSKSLPEWSVTWLVSNDA